MGKYDRNTATDDSSPGYEDYIAEADDEPGFETGTVIILRVGDKGQRTCGCGCLTTMDTDSTFRQGHDARFKGILQRAHVRGSHVAIVDAGGVSDASAMHWAEQRGWERFLESAAVQAERKATKASTRKPGRTAGKTANSTILADMKAAAGVLKIIGRYGRDAGDRQIKLERGNYQQVLDATHPDLDVHPSGLVQGQTIKANRRGWRDATIAEFAGDRAKIVYETDSGNETEALVEVDSIKAWMKEQQR